MPDDKSAGNPEALREYWRQAINWGHPGDFDQCVAEVGKYIEEPEGFCALRHQEATGAWPGHAPGESRKKDSAPFEDSEVELQEILTLDAPTVQRFGMHITSSGYLVAEPRIARTGIQIYRGSELGRPDLEDVRVYRPANEVFDKRAMASLAHRPVTLDHPDRIVDPSNWREFAVGHSTGDVARDGEFIRVPLALMDAAAITAVQSGRSQLSVGYAAKLKWGPGETSDGQLYDAMQTEIRANHIALVSKARGGDKLKMGDDLFDEYEDAGDDYFDREFSTAQRAKAAEKGQAMPHGGFPIKTESDLRNAIRAIGRAKNPAAAKAHIKKRAKALGLSKLIPASWGDSEGDHNGSHERSKTMTERTLTIDGVSITLEDKDSQILERHLVSLTTKLGDSENKVAEMKKAIETKDGEIIGLTKKLADAEWTPQKRDEAIRTSIEVFERARRVLGDKLVTDGKSDITIKREVVAAEIGDDEAKAMSDEAISGVFRAVTRETNNNDGLRRTVSALSQPALTMNPSQIAHQKYVERLANAHKQKSA